MSVSVPDQDATRASIAASATNVQLFAATGRNGGRTVWNEGSTVLYLAFGAAAATTTDYTVQIPVGGYYEFPASRFYGGIVNGIWAGAPTGAARCTEW